VSFAPVSDVVFVEDDYPMTTAHELSHTYGLGHSGDSPGQGDWVQKYPNGFFLNGHENYMSPITEKGIGYRSAAPPLTWTTPDQFSELFGGMRAPANDPELLIVAGFVDAQGTTNVTDVDYAQAGNANQDSAGTVSIQVLDAARNILQTTGFSPSFTASEEMVQLLPTSPFVMAIPFPHGGQMVQIVSNGQVKAQFFIASQLLSQAITSLPDSAFVQNAKQMRTALLNQVKALDSALAAGANAGKGAHNILEQVIRPEIQNWILNTYVPESPLQYGKSEILQIVDRLAQGE
jgi:hypothetical protein